MASFKDKYSDYIIHLDGRVFSLKTNKFLKYGISNAGYKIYVLCHKGQPRTFTLARLLAETYIPNPENLKCVNHIDGNKLNDSIDNLEWCTPGYNRKHAYDRGLWVASEKHKESAKKQGALNGKKGKLVKWCHPYFGVVECSATELVCRYPFLKLNQGSLSAVSLGKYTNHKEWRIIE